MYIISRSPRNRRKMPRALFACSTIVAAFLIHLAAASLVVEEAPIAPPVAALAARLELEPSRDRVHFMAEAARLLYATQDSKPPSLTAVRAAANVPAAGAVTVRVPLGAIIWSRAIFRRSVPADQLVGAILSDRRAAL